MVKEQASTDAYLEMVKNNFLNAVSRKAELQNSFRPEMSRELNETVDTILKNAVELVKLGQMYSRDGNDIGIMVGNTTYDIPREELKKRISNEEYEALFGEGEQEVNNYDNEFSKKNDQPYVQQDTFGNIPPMYSNLQVPPVFMPYGYNPMNAMMPTYNPYMQHPFNEIKSYNPNESEVSSASIMREISEIQKKVVLLEKEKDGVKENNAQLIAQRDELKKSLEDAEASRNTFEEENRLLSEKVAILNELETKIAQNESDINEKDATIAALYEEKEESTSKLKKLEEEYKNKHDEDLKKLTRLEQDREYSANEKAKLKESLQNVSSERDSFRDKFNNINEKFHNLNTEYEVLKNKYEAEKRQYDVDVVEARKLSEETIAELKTRSEAEINGLKEQYEKNIEELKNKYNSDIENSNKEHQSELKDTMEKYEKELDKAIRQTEENVKNKLHEDIKNASESSKREAQRAMDLQKNNDSLKVEIENLKKELEKKTLENTSLTEDLDKITASMKSMQSERDKFKNLAYNDTKFKVKNANAFNAEYPACEREPLIISYISINGIKEINSLHGKHDGDRVIYAVADALKSAFNSDSVYRIMGDQFIVLSKNTTQNSVQGQLTDVERNLSVSEISISYGTVYAGNYQSHREALEAAEENMKRMKEFELNGNKSNSSLYSNVMQSVSPVKERVEENTTSDMEEVNLDAALLDFMNNN